MEQEETKTTAATGVEMPPEAESWVQLHESELTELMQKQAKAAITELKRQEKQERKKEKYHNTFTLMKCYRDAVFHIENAISDGQQLELKGMTDEQQRTYLESIRRTRFKTLIMTAHIDKAVEEIERRREAAGRGVEYKASFVMLAHVCCTHVAQSQYSIMLIVNAPAAFYSLKLLVQRCYCLFGFFRARLCLLFHFLHGCCQLFNLQLQAACYVLAQLVLDTLKPCVKFVFSVRLE